MNEHGVCGGVAVCVWRLGGGTVVKLSNVNENVGYMDRKTVKRKYRLQYGTYGTHQQGGELHS